MKFDRFFQVSMVPMLALVMASSCSPAKTKPAQGEKPASTAGQGLSGGDTTITLENARLKANASALSADRAMADADFHLKEQAAVTAAVWDENTLWSNTPAGKRPNQSLVIFRVLSSGAISYLEGAQPDEKSGELVPSSMIRSSQTATEINLSRYDANENNLHGNEQETVNAILGAEGELLLLAGEDSGIKNRVYYPIKAIHVDTLVEYDRQNKGLSIEQ